jgi:hypothetical protein
MPRWSVGDLGDVFTGTTLVVDGTMVPVSSPAKRPHENRLDHSENVPTGDNRDELMNMLATSPDHLPRQSCSFDRSENARR